MHIKVDSNIYFNKDEPIGIYSNCEGQNFIIIKELTLFGTMFTKYIIKINVSTQKQPGCKKKVRPCLKWPV